MTSTTAHDTCIVFADVSGSTRLYEQLGDTRALAAVESCLEAMRQATRLNRGRVVKTIGDEIMAVFDSAAQGMQAASEMQQRIDALPPPAPGVKLAIRAGFHCGPALHGNDDVYGDAVNTAARMARLAKPGQIIATAGTVAALPDPLRQSCRELDAFAIKGKAENVHVCEVIWQESADLTMVSARAPASVAADTCLRLRHGGAAIALSPARTTATLGRDPASDIAILDPRASRSHARIELRRDKFVLVDLSSNGTYVTFRGETEFALRREEAILRGSGHIVFGHAATGNDETVEFDVAAGLQNPPAAPT